VIVEEAIVVVVRKVDVVVVVVSVDTVEVKVTVGEYTVVLALVALVTGTVVVGEKSVDV